MKQPLINNDRFVLLCFFLSVIFSGFPQNKQVDSLKLVLNSASAIADTQRIKALNDLSWYYREEGNLEEAIKTAAEAKALAQKNRYTRGLITSVSYLGLSYQSMNNYGAALEYFSEAEKLYEVYPDKTGSANNQTNIGNVLADKGNYPAAIEKYYKALKIYEAVRNKEGIASTYNNLGIVYSYQENFEKTLEYFNKALNINQELGRKKSVINCLGNMGNVYYFMHQYGKALEYHFKATELNEQTGNKWGLSDNYGNIAAVYIEQTDSDFIKQGLKPADRYSLSIKYARKALLLNEELGSKLGIVSGYLNIGWIFFKQKKYEESYMHLQKAYAIAKENGLLEYVKEAAQKLSTLFHERGDDKRALGYYKDFIAAGDSLKNEENTKKQTALEMNYEFEKKEAAAKMEQEKKDAVAAAESRKQKIVIYSVSGGLVLILLLAGVIFRSLRLNQKKNRIITEQKEAVERQKEIVEEKQKEILDSIHYAKRIQTALLPGDAFLAKNLKGVKK
ncbi:MAG: tetratricopeptide repeat protein [Bacteroidia bacterium]